MRRLAALLILLSIAGCAPVDQSPEAAARRVILDSYEKFDVTGVTEELVNSEGSWTMVYDPSRVDYQAAWFETATSNSELIFETDYFSVYVAYLMLNDRDFEVEQTPTGFALTSKNWALIRFGVKNGLIVSAESDSYSPWKSKVSYLVSRENRERLIKLEKELIASLALAS